MAIGQTFCHSMMDALFFAISESEALQLPNHYTVMLMTDDGHGNGDGSRCVHFRDREYAEAFAEHIDRAFCLNADISSDSMIKSWNVQVNGVSRSVFSPYNLISSRCIQR